MSERQRQRPPGSDGRPDDGTAQQSGPQPVVPQTPREQRRRQRIRRLRELVREADYDVPSEDVAARIIRDALFGAPGPDEPS